MKMRDAVWIQERGEGGSLNSISQKRTWIRFLGMGWDKKEGERERKEKGLSESCKKRNPTCMLTVCLSGLASWLALHLSAPQVAKSVERHGTILIGCITTPLPPSSPNPEKDDMLCINSEIAPLRVWKRPNPGFQGPGLQPV